MLLNTGLHECSPGYKTVLSCRGLASDPTIRTKKEKTLMSDCEAVTTGRGNLDEHKTIFRE